MKSKFHVRIYRRAIDISVGMVGAIGGLSAPRQMKRDIQSSERVKVGRACSLSLHVQLASLMLTFALKKDDILQGSGCAGL